MTEKTFEPDVGELKEKTTRSKSSPMQSQETCVPRELLSLNEEVEMSLDGLYVNRQLFEIYLSHETHCRKAIPTESVEEKNIMKALEDIFQVCYTCGSCVVKFKCEKNRTHS